MFYWPHILRFDFRISDIGLNSWSIWRPNKYKGILIFWTSKGNKNWLQVWDIGGKFCVWLRKGTHLLNDASQPRGFANWMVKEIRIAWYLFELLHSNTLLLCTYSFCPSVTCLSVCLCVCEITYLGWLFPFFASMAPFSVPRREVSEVHHSKNEFMNVFPSYAFCVF